MKCTLTRVKVENRSIERYNVYLAEKSRPPSRGGNGGAWHQHRLTIDGETYSFLAAHSGKFVYKRETVSFEWDWDKSRRYRNVEVTSIVAYNSNGQTILRGDRNPKTWRTAETRLPAGRRERKD